MSLSAALRYPTVPNVVPTLYPTSMHQNLDLMTDTSIEQHSKISPRCPRTSQAPRSTTRSRADEANDITYATPTTQNAAARFRGRWTAASGCVSAASIEESSSSKLPEHTHGTQPAGTSTSACSMVLRALAPRAKACTARQGHCDDDCRCRRQQPMHLSTR